MPTVNVDNEKLFHNLGLESQYEKLAGESVKLTYAMSGLKFTANKKLVANAPISPAKAADIVSGKIALPDPVAQTIKASLQAAAAAAFTALKAPAEMPADDADKPASNPAKTGPVPFYEGNMFTGERISLKHAAKLYQPVFGTDQDSRYFTVGVAPGS